MMRGAGLLLFASSCLAFSFLPTSLPRRLEHSALKTQLVYQKYRCSIVAVAENANMAPKNAKIAPKSHNNEKIAQKTLVTAVTLQYLNVLSAAAEFVPPLPDEMVQAAKQGKMTFEPRGITAQDTVVFVIGMIPFFWATNEFWRRIAAGEPFGTGDGSVVIRPDDATTEVKGSPRRVLTSGAMNLAYFLFAAVGVTGALVAAAVVQAAKI